MSKTKNIFDTWMHKEARLVQQVARSYGERVCHERVSMVLNDCADRVKYQNL